MKRQVSFSWRGFRSDFGPAAGREAGDVLWKSLPILPSAETARLSAGGELLSRGRNISASPLPRARAIGADLNLTDEEERLPAGVAAV